MSDNCSTISVCSKGFGSGIQTDQRSSSDRTDFQGGITQYMYIKGQYYDQNQTPKFTSNKDYVVWKRMNAQLHSNIRVVSSIH